MKKGNEEKKDRDHIDTVAAADLVIVCDKEVINFAYQETSWVIDNGVVLHATLKKELFSSYMPGNFGVVKMGNENYSKVADMGDIHLETNKGAWLILKDVRHVPDIRFNLILVRRLDDKGYCNTFGNGQWKLTKGSLVVARGEKSPSLYVTQANIVRDFVNTVEDEKTVEMWHKRLSHISENGLNCLAKKDLLLGVKRANSKKCVHCMVGKQNRVAFKSHSPSRQSILLELVHYEICGPMKVKIL